MALPAASQVDAAEQAIEPREEPDCPGGAGTPEIFTAVPLIDIATAVRGLAPTASHAPDAQQETSTVGSSEPMAPGIAVSVVDHSPLDSSATSSFSPAPSTPRAVQLTASAHDTFANWKESPGVGKTDSLQSPPESVHTTGDHANFGVSRVPTAVQLDPLQAIPPSPSWL
jgi:hypothetical protein